MMVSQAGRFAFVGALSGANTLHIERSGVEVVDLQGRTVIPVRDAGQNFLFFSFSFPFLLGCCTPFTSVQRTGCPKQQQ